MAVDDKTKSLICRVYDNKDFKTIKAMAAFVGVSTRTFNRVLVEKGRMPKQIMAFEEARKIVQIMRGYQIDSAKQLKTILTDYFIGQASLLPAPGTPEVLAVVKETSKPVEEMSKEQVQNWLNRQSVDTLASLFYMVGLIKIAEIHNSSVMNSTQRMQEAAAKTAADPIPAAAPVAPPQKESINYAPKPQHYYPSR